MLRASAEQQATSLYVQRQEQDTCDRLTQHLRFNTLKVFLCVGFIAFSRRFLLRNRTPGRRCACLGRAGSAAQAHEIRFRFPKTFSGYRNTHSHQGGRRESLREYTLLKAEILTRDLSSPASHISEAPRLSDIDFCITEAVYRTAKKQVLSRPAETALRKEICGLRLYRKPKGDFRLLGYLPSIDIAVTQEKALYL